MPPESFLAPKKEFIGFRQSDKGGWNFFVPLIEFLVKSLGN